MGQVVIESLPVCLGDGHCVNDKAHPQPGEEFCFGCSVCHAMQETVKDAAEAEAKRAEALAADEAQLSAVMAYSLEQAKSGETASRHHTDVLDDPRSHPNQECLPFRRPVCTSTSLRSTTQIVQEERDRITAVRTEHSRTARAQAAHATNSRRAVEQGLQMQQEGDALRLARGSPATNYRHNGQTTYASFDEAREHASSRCEHHINMLRERESATGKEIPAYTYASMHRTDEWLSPQNRYLACTIYPGGKDEVLKVYASPDANTKVKQFAQATEIMRQTAEQRSLRDQHTTSIADTVRQDSYCNGTTHKSQSIKMSITEKEMLAEERAHKSMRQATEKYGATDAECNGMQNTTTYNLNGIFYRQILPVSVRDLSKVSIGYEPDKSRTTLKMEEWAEELKERRNVQVKIKDEAYMSYMAAMDGSSGEGCPSAPVYVGSSNISWGSPSADKARQVVEQLCGQVIVFTVKQDCFALTSSLHHVGDSSSCWGRGLRAEGIRKIIQKRYNKSNQWIEITTKEFGIDYLESGRPSDTTQ